ncbi:MAG: hypothetical protein NZM38_02055 [Cytophagales bacterium]|nr:hypothetical protein [Cytophagales bacterium]MDW8383535.1 hypothetical protein [Flammeovirgaceae bacterium]
MKFLKEYLIYGPLVLLLVLYVIVGALLYYFFGKQKDHEWDMSHYTTVVTPEMQKRMRIEKLNMMFKQDSINRSR